MLLTHELGQKRRLTAPEYGHASNETAKDYSFRH